ncbi:hypothetical protein AQUSIP_09030 [Aquicella siphonis]|uniref:Uncharacterized protein n=1 Tax=Aquicella siphonis TaxID=254247 RepID=A0A5E4PGX9_9COXI|nr:hypothetical protein [Aquicella siphonis]VVC75613.1 hypothetical protein AQUSIP_09030 [Aquicella siphonis]
MHRREGQRGKEKSRERRVKRVPASHLERLKGVEVEKAEDSAHHVDLVHKVHKEHLRGRGWFLKTIKPTKEEPEHFQIEAALGDYYRLMVGVREPKNRPVAQRYDDSKTLELISKGVEGFKPLAKRPLNFKNPQQLKDLAEILVACYFLEEIDLHEDNIGFDKHNRVVKIDHGMSLWPIMQRYAVRGGKDVEHDIVPDELRRFPSTDEESQAAWGITADKADVLMCHPVFVAAKFKAMLKIALLPDEAIADIADAYVSDSHLVDEIAGHLIERRNQLIKSLYQVPEFIDYLIKNPRAVEDILADIDVYNGTFKEKDAHRRVSIDAMRRQYNSLFPEQGLKFLQVKHKMLTAIEERLTGLKGDAKLLAGIKKDFYTELKTDIGNVTSMQGLRKKFNDWLESRYEAQGPGDAHLGGKTYREILSHRRVFLNPIPPKSTGFISDMQALLVPEKKDKKQEKEPISYYYDESDEDRGYSDVNEKGSHRKREY